jgi:hypothetical protein
VLRLKLKKLLVISLITLLCLSVLVSLSTIPMAHAQSYNIQSIQGPITGEADSGTTVTFTLNSAPISGDLLIACIGGTGSAGESISSITETGVTWTPQETNTANTGFVTAIWAGVVGSGAVKGGTVTFSQTLNGGTFAYVDEYSGLLTTGFLDKINLASGTSTTAATGTTATTSDANELAIGVIFGGEVFSSQTNGFKPYGNTVYDYDAMVYLSLIVSQTGAQSCSMTQANGYTFQGCIATFIAAAVVTTAQIIFTSNPTGSGFITVNGTAETTPYTIASANIGDTYDISANTPANTVTNETQYVFTQWASTSIGTKTTASYAYVVPAVGETVTASFTEQYAIAPSSDSDSSLTPSTVTWVNSGGNQLFSYTANTGYAIATVMIDGVPFSITGSYQFSDVVTYHTILVTSISTATPTAPPSGSTGGGTYPNPPTGTLTVSNVALGYFSVNQTGSASLTLTFTDNSWTVESVTFGTPFSTWVSANVPSGQFTAGVLHVPISYAVPSYMTTGIFTGTVTVVVQDACGTTYTGTSKITITILPTPVTNIMGYIHAHLLLVCVAAIIFVLAICGLIATFSRRRH